jgi:hypothetical protein
VYTHVIFVFGAALMHSEMHTSILMSTQFMQLHGSMEFYGLHEQLRHRNFKYIKAIIIIIIKSVL